MAAKPKSNGIVAEWLGRGLQNLLQQFESARYLTNVRHKKQGTRFKPRLKIQGSSKVQESSLKKFQAANCKGMPDGTRCKKNDSENFLRLVPF